jgi:hypothetical protein
MTISIEISNDKNIPADPPLSDEAVVEMLKPT